MEDEALAHELHQEEKDARYAQKVEQELHDEELARQLARAEERALAAEERARGPPPRRPCGGQRVCSYMVPLIIVAVGSLALIFALTKTGTTVSVPPFDVTNPGQFFQDHDPWEGVAPGEVVRWRNGGSGGLQLKLLDALESHWEDIFHEVVADWDNGTPDVLELSTEKNGHDAECEPEDDRSKVCNGDYGETDWRGINQINIQSGYIRSTTSRMNEYYLSGASDVQRRYTMCHEIGHGFGLPHSDEDFFNADLGNCMDYTANPAANMSPDASNFEFLEELYGTLPTRVRGLQELDRTLMQRNRDQDLTALEGPMPDSIREKLREVVPKLEKRTDGRALEDGWRLLHSSEHGEAHAMDLGDGWSVQIHKIRPEERF